MLSISACGFYQTPTAPAQTHAAMTEDLKVLLEADPELMDGPGLCGSFLLHTRIKLPLGIDFREGITHTFLW